MGNLNSNGSKDDTEKVQLYRKWRNIFQLFDENTEGVITVEDFGVKAQRLIINYGLEGAEAVKVTQTLLRWWKVCQKMYGEQKKSISEDEFVDALQKLYEKNKKELENEMRDLSWYLFELMDYNKDGVISAEELYHINKCFGQADRHVSETIFRRWDTNSDGVISKEEYQEGMTQYIISVDPTNDVSFIFQFESKRHPSTSHEQLLLEKKWRNFFKMFDEDGDSYITVQDFGLKAQRIITTYKLDSVDSVKATQNVMRWWKVVEKLLGHDKKRITEDEYVDALGNLYRNDRAELEHSATALSQHLFTIMDANGDGLISSEELNLMNKCLSRDNNVLNQAIFDKWDVNRDGFISKEEYYTGMVAYMCSSDQNNDFGFIFDFEKLNNPLRKRSLGRMKIKKK